MKEQMPSSWRWREPRAASCEQSNEAEEEECTGGSSLQLRHMRGFMRHHGARHRIFQMRAIIDPHGGRAPGVQQQLVERRVFLRHQPRVLVVQAAVVVQKSADAAAVTEHTEHNLAYTTS